MSGESRGRIRWHVAQWVATYVPPRFLCVCCSHRIAVVNAYLLSSTNQPISLKRFVRPIMEFSNFYSRIFSRKKQRSYVHHPTQLKLSGTTAPDKYKWTCCPRAARRNALTGLSTQHKKYDKLAQLTR